MMPAFSRFLCAAALSLAFLLAPAAARAVAVEEVVSPGGVTAWLVRDPTIPVVSLTTAFRGGAALDPEGKAGLASLVSGLLDEGAGDLDSQSFQGRLNDLSIKLRFDAGRDEFSGDLKTLKENLDAAFDMLRLALTEPRFDPEPVERVRNQLLSILARQAEDPNYVAAHTWNRIAFPDHPYGRPVDGTPETIKAIMRADLEEFVKERLAKDNLVIGVVGDVTAEELAPLLDSTFGALPDHAVPASVPDVAPKNAGDVIVVPRDIPQSVVVFGEQGLKRDDPDYYAAYVLNYILGGGGFTSRLTREIRELRGLAYSVYTYLNPLDHAALVMGGVATRNSRVKESIDLIRAEWDGINHSSVTAEELADAKSYLTGSFALRLNTTAKIAQILAYIQMNDLGIDYLDRRNGLIEAVTPADLSRVAKRLFVPGNLTFVVVGAPEGVETVTSPPGAPPPAAAASDSEPPASAAPEPATPPVDGP